VASISKIVSVLACGVLLGVGLPSTAARGADWMKGDHEGFGGQSGLEREAGQLKGAIVERGDAVQRDALYIEGTNYVVKGQDSKEVGLHTDDTTRQTGNIRQRDPRSDGERGRSDASKGAPIP
jgi:hypothetical protein